MARNPMADLAAMIAAKKSPQKIVKPKTLALPPEPELILRLEIGRCEHARNSIHPQTFKRVWLQCVEEPGHAGACMFENPANRKKR